MKKTIEVSIIAIILAIVLASTISRSPTESEHAGTKWTGPQEIMKSGTVPTIAIPGIDRMYFVAGQTSQKVNIHNPDSNSVDIVFTLSVDGETIWKSEATQPGYGYYDIELTHALDPGKYNATLLHECFRDGAQLNSAKIDFTLEVS